MNTEKAIQRKLIKELKKSALNEQGKLNLSKQIFDKVELLPQFIKAKTVLAYWSLPDEVNTHSFILKWNRDKRFILPVVNGNDLDLRIFNGIEKMERGAAFGILEPVRTDENIEIKDIDLAIVPGVAFDAKGNRLGRGKGYYDKLLVSNRIYKVGVCFPFQLLPQVAVSDHDIPMDIVVTP